MPMPSTKMPQRSALILLPLLLGHVAADAPLPYHYRHPGRLDHRAFRGAENPEWQRRTRRLVAAAEQSLPRYASDASAGVVSPADFGGDPSGKMDSSPAFFHAIAELLSLGGGRKNGANQTDLGGATLSLGGGVWAVSRPISIPAFYANYRIEGGTIIAHPSFGAPAAYTSRHPPEKRARLYLSTPAASSSACSLYTPKAVVGA
eukprot:COSAG01_NODE_5191_length_4421_cov_59.692503_6_plen_204_part_00